MAERSLTWAIFNVMQHHFREKKKRESLKKMDVSLSCFLSEGKGPEPPLNCLLLLTSIDFSNGGRLPHRFEVNSSLICGQEFLGHYVTSDSKYWFSWFPFGVAHAVQRSHSVCTETVCVRLWWGNWMWEFASCALDLGGFKYCSPTSTFNAL